MNGNEMFEALAARGPHPEIAEKGDAIYAPFAGSWDVEVFDLEGDGARRVSRGEWHFAWVLEGRAMQDVLLVPPRGERRNGALAKGNRCAITLRVFDSANGMWRVHYFNPLDRSEETLVAQADNKAIVQTGNNAHGISLRQAFGDITPSSFAMRREVSNGGFWKLESEYFAKRKSSPK
jgi:hypothetical protein